MSRSAESYDRVVRAVCSPNCSGTCGVMAHVRDNRIVKLEPASFPDPGYERICLRGIAMATERVTHPDRLRHPLIRTGARGAGGWREASWDEANDYIAERMRAIADRHGWRANSLVSMSGNYGVKSTSAAERMANCIGGTYFSRLGISSDGAAFMGYLPITGRAYASHDISEVEGARYFLSVGKNIADTGHSEMHFLFDAMEKGCKFVMVDPRFSRSAAKADEWIAPNPGTDTALAMGLIHVVIEQGLIDEAYVLAHTNAPFLVRTDNRQCLRERDVRADGGDAYMVWDDAAGAPRPAGAAGRPALRGGADVVLTDGSTVACRTAFDLLWDVLRHHTPARTAEICGIPADQVRKVATDYARADPAWIWIGFGPQRYTNGHTMVRAWVTLGALCGNIGKPYAGVSTIDGPNLLLSEATPEWMMPQGKKGHGLTGTKMVEIIASGAPYPIKSLWILNYNFSSQSPLFKRFLSEALPELELFAVTEQVMTQTAEYADIVLPCVSYYEDDWDVVGSGESWFVQLRRRAIDPIGVSRNDSDIFGGVCARLGIDPEDWQIDPEQSAREMLSRHTDPRIRAIDWEALKRDGVARVPVERPYTPFRDQRFDTPSGRIELYQEQFADIGEHVLAFEERAEGPSAKAVKDHPLTLITYKHVHSTHSQHVILPLIRQVMPEPRLEISPADAAERSIADDDLVTVFNERGRFKVKASVSLSVRPGTVGLTQGWWHRHFVEGHPGDLGHVPESKGQNRIMETNWAAFDVLCNVVKANEPCPASLPL